MWALCTYRHVRRSLSRERCVVFLGGMCVCMCVCVRVSAHISGCVPFPMTEVNLALPQSKPARLVPTKKCVCPLLL